MEQSSIQNTNKNQVIKCSGNGKSDKYDMNDKSIKLINLKGDTQQEDWQSKEVEGIIESDLKYKYQNTTSLSSEKLIYLTSEEYIKDNEKYMTESCKIELQHLKLFLMDKVPDDEILKE